MKNQDFPIEEPSWVSICRIEIEQDIKPFIFWSVCEIWINEPQFLISNILRSEVIQIFGNNKYHTKLIPKIHRENNIVEQMIMKKEEKSENGELITCIIDTEPLEASLIKESKLPFYYPKASRFQIIYKYQQVNERSLEVRCLPTGNDCNLVSALSTLLKKFYKFMKSSFNAPGGVYVKRIFHDIIVPKALFQDMYQEMKIKYKHWVELWGKDAGGGHGKGNMTTDPKKHVFEEVAIATFIICLWKEHLDKDNIRFVDLGCGNGFLSHILTTEGYKGYVFYILIFRYGCDISKRKIWDLYSCNLIEETIDAPSLIFDLRNGMPLKDAVDQDCNRKLKELWIIGNHADELTPWIPIICAKTNITFKSDKCKAFLIPCCFHDLNGNKNSFGRDIPVLNSVDGKYELYIKWIESIIDTCGYEVEREWFFFN
jgi:hypothetical protein